MVNHWSLNNQLKLLPLIELPTVKSADAPAKLFNLSHDEKNKYRESELLKNYSTAFKPISPEMPYQYSIDEITRDEDWIKILELQFGGTNPNDYFGLFGGYALSINNKIKLYPQCCGTLEEINDWKKILSEGFEPFYLQECHPAPKFYDHGENLIIECLEDETGPFVPNTQREIIVNLTEIRAAIQNLIVEMEKFSKSIDRLSIHFEVNKISDYIVWGNYT